MVTGPVLYLWFTDGLTITASLVKNKILFLKLFPWNRVKKSINLSLVSNFLVLKPRRFKDYLFFVLGGFFLLLPFHSSAQLGDSLKKILRVKPTFDFRLDSRNNFISSRKASTYGIKLGFDFDSRLRLGVGFNFLNSKFYDRSIAYQPPPPSVVSQRLILRYTCVYVDYVYYQTKKWTFSVPVQLGFGRTRYREIYPDFNGRETGVSPIILYEPCLSGEYRFLPWLAVSANAGFRMVILKGASLKQRLTAPVYVGGLSIYWTRLYKVVFPGRGEWYDFFKTASSP
jgi:hypothetical protein